MNICYADNVSPNPSLSSKASSTAWYHVAIYDTTWHYWETLLTFIILCAASKYSVPSSLYLMQFSVYIIHNNIIYLNTNIYIYNLPFSADQLSSCLWFYNNHFLSAVLLPCSDLQGLLSCHSNLVPLQTGIHIYIYIR